MKRSNAQNLDEDCVKNNREQRGNCVKKTFEGKTFSEHPALPRAFMCGQPSRAFLSHLKPCTAKGSVETGARKPPSGYPTHLESFLACVKRTGSFSVTKRNAAGKIGYWYFCLMICRPTRDMRCSTSCPFRTRMALGSTFACSTYPTRRIGIERGSHLRPGCTVLSCLLCLLCRDNQSMPSVNTEKDRQT